jgi:hypothetical protein
MFENQPTDPRIERRLRDRRLKEQVGKQLRDYYQTCLSEELPPGLLAVLKKLDEETEQENKPQVIVPED